MRVLSIVHQTDAAAGVFADAVAERGHELDEWVIPTSPSRPHRSTTTAPCSSSAARCTSTRKTATAGSPTSGCLLQRLVADEVPLMGVCLGGQLVAKALHGTSAGCPAPRSAGPTSSSRPRRPTTRSSRAARALPRLPVAPLHFELPEGAVPLARNERCLQAFRAGPAAWAIQFHAEVTHESVALLAPRLRPGRRRDRRRRGPDGRDGGADRRVERVRAGALRALPGGGGATQAARGATTRATSPRS